MTNPSAKSTALRRMCGQLVVGGFEGTTLPDGFTRGLIAGERGGAVLFARNLTGDLMQCAELSRAIAANSSLELPPLIAIDQEGGRVQRLKAPVLQLPPMRALGRKEHAGLVRDAGEALGRQLGALGITMDFAPVVDLDTRAENPIIGDRSFGADAGLVGELGGRFAAGVRAAGVLSCAKHFPGHGDTTKDSHLDLPVVDLDRAQVAEVHARPFLEPGAGYDAIMTAHVMYPALDREMPATLSRGILGLARPGFAGCLVSDDLEMKAIADRWPIEESAVKAIEAGCDVLLICRSEALQERAVEALAWKAAADAGFRARVEDAHGRFVAMRRRATAKPVKTRGELEAAGAMAREVAPRIAAAIGRRSGR